LAHVRFGDAKVIARPQPSPRILPKLRVNLMIVIGLP
jgi:hypothetical protein